MGALDKVDISLKNKISQRIKLLREEKNVNQSTFAKNTLKDRQTVHRWESGRGVSIYTINKLCKEFKITLADFFDHHLFK